MIRTALRLSAVAALANGGTEPYPTLANGYIFDSRQDFIDDLTAAMRVPVIVVRTDDDDALLDRRNRTILLRLELSVLSARRDPEDETKLLLGWPQTDAGLEAMLDLMEYQAKSALLGFGEWAQWWRGLWLGADNNRMQSLPIWTQTAAGRVKVAARELTLFVRTQLDCPPPLRRDFPDEPPAWVGLPPPLPAIFDKVETDGDGDMKLFFAQLRAQLEAQRLPEAPVAAAFERLYQTIESIAGPIETQDPPPVP